MSSFVYTLTGFVYIVGHKRLKTAPSDFKFGNIVFPCKIERHVSYTNVSKVSNDFVLVKYYICLGKCIWKVFKVFFDLIVFLPSSI